MSTLEYEMRKTHHLIELSSLQKVVKFYELLGYRPYYKWISEERENTELIDVYRETVRE